MPPGFDDVGPGDDHKGHRKRLRERFRVAGGDALPDYELLELLLFLSRPRIDTKPIAKQLLKEFGSFAGVIGASYERLKKVRGVGEETALDLKLMEAAAQRVIRGEIINRPVLNTWSRVLDYCKSRQAHSDREEFSILFLDKKNQLIADEVQQTGTVDHTPVYPREVVKRALELAASAVILVHNHPSGDPTPSAADLDMTRRIVEAGDKLAITVHDHIIVGRNGHASFRALKLLK